MSSRELSRSLTTQMSMLEKPLPSRSTCQRSEFRWDSDFNQLLLRTLSSVHLSSTNSLLSSLPSPVLWCVWNSMCIGLSILQFILILIDFTKSLKLMSLPKWNYLRCRWCWHYCNISLRLLTTNPLSTAYFHIWVGKWKIMRLKETYCSG